MALEFKNPKTETVCRLVLALDDLQLISYPSSRWVKWKIDLGLKGILLQRRKLNEKKGEMLFLCNIYNIN